MRTLVAAAVEVEELPSRERRGLVGLDQVGAALTAPLNVGEDKRAVVVLDPRGADREAFLCLAAPVLTQHRHRVDVESDRPPGGVGLAVVLPHGCVAGHRHRLTTHVDDPLVQVDVGPTQAEQLGAAYPRGGHEMPSGVEPVAPH